MRFPVSQRDRDHTEKRRAFFDEVASQHLSPGPFKRYYNDRLSKWLKFNVPEGASILDLGCGLGDLLASLKPSFGVGVDFSEKMISLAQQRHPELTFIQADVAQLNLTEQFDFIILSNLVGDLVDILQVFAGLETLSHDRTRVIVTNFNYLWSPLVKFAEYINIKPRQREQNWLEMSELQNLLLLTGFETVKSSKDMLFPVHVPMIAELINNYLGLIPGLSKLSANELVIARPSHRTLHKEYSVSVIVACKDERGNIEELVKTVPKMGLWTEIIFVDGHSEDGTVEEIQRCIDEIDKLNPSLSAVRVMEQQGKGKGDAVRMGFDAADGDVLMILDADITVCSEELPKFYYALSEGKGEFINGSRLVYPMDDQAMRFLNLLGNHFFGKLFSWLLDQRLTDTLCGTKVLFKKDYEAIKQGRAFFGDFDPFGDFDLLFGAAKQNMKICEVPVRYRNREYGEIKISRFRHGLLLLKMSALAFKRFKLNVGK